MESTRETRVNEIDRLLSLVPDGPKKYNTDATFRASVECLIRGQEPIILIDQICDTINKQSESIKKLVERFPTPIDFL